MFAKKIEQPTAIEQFDWLVLREVVRVGTVAAQTRVSPAIVCAAINRGADSDVHAGNTAFRINARVLSIDRRGAQSG